MLEVANAALVPQPHHLVLSLKNGHQYQQTFYFGDICWGFCWFLWSSVGIQSHTHTGLPEDEASVWNSFSFHLPCRYAAIQLNCSRNGNAQEWPDGRPLWNQSMVLKQGETRSPAASLPPCMHCDTAEGQIQPQAWEMLLCATLWKTFLNHQFVCNVPPPAGSLVVIAQPQAPVVKVILQNAFCTVLTTVHHVYRVLMSPLTLRHFLRNLGLDAMDCSVKNIHKTVFRWGKLAWLCWVQWGQVNSISSGA